MGHGGLIVNEISPALAAAERPRFRPYPTYKESGVEWLGEIPATWQLKRLKRIVEFLGGGTPSKDNIEYWSGNIPWVSPKDMKSSVVLDTEDKITAEAVRESATRLVPSGAVLIVVRSGILIHSIPVAIAGREVALNQDLKALIPASEVTSDYLAYLVSGMQGELLVEWRKEGATVESLELELIANTLTPVPPVDEQRVIAGFLDRETAKIDALVAKKERLIELLSEQRNALIAEAVARSPSVSEVRLKYYVDLLPGYAFPSPEFSHDPDDVRLLRGVNVSTGATRWDDVAYWPRIDVDRFDAYQLQEGDIVFGMDRPWVNGGIRVAEIRDGDVPSLLLQRVARLRTKNGLGSGYLKLILSAPQFLAYFEPILTGVSVPHVSPEQILSFAVRLPEVHIQEAVYRHVQSRLELIEFDV